MSFLQPRPIYRKTNTDEDQPWSEAIPLGSTYASTANDRQQGGKTFSFMRSVETDQPLLSASTTYKPNAEGPRTISPSSTNGLRHERHSLLSGWRTGALIAAITALASLLANVAALVWLSKHTDAATSLIEVFKGRCNKVSTIDMWTHLAINTISTLLLSGSNYCMQCLCAPTRDEVDKAHTSRTYVDIGIQSLRNLRNIRRIKLAYWIMLAVTSVPLHLMYNSSFYSSMAVNDYMIYVVRPSFFTTSNITILNGDHNANDIQSVDLYDMRRRSRDFERLDKKACIQAYAQPLMTDRRTLIIVTSDDTTLNTTILTSDQYILSTTASNYAPFDWICRSDPDYIEKWDVRGNLGACDSWVSKIEARSDEWTPYGYNTEYCLSETVPESCSYNANIPIIAIVIFCNLVKAVVMLIVAYRLPGQPLITIGDAIENFLQRPDPTTEDQCLWAKQDYLQPKRFTQPRRAETKSVRWFHTASGTITIVLLVVAIIVILALLGAATTSIKANNGSITDVGFGASVHVEAIISGWAIELINPKLQVLASVLIANLPQLILSFIYLNVNTLYTTFWLAQEWNQFSIERKSLRVSNPKGEQRSTHFLQLPYKVSVPLILGSAILHWLVSQSIFLAVVARYNVSGALESATAISSCGFSPEAMIAVVLAATALLGSIILAGRRTFTTNMPLALSSSAAISAACHPPPWDVDAHLKPVLWGEVSTSISSKNSGVGHCSFSSGPVEHVQDGKRYAGVHEGHV